MKLTNGLKGWVRSRKNYAASFDDADAFKSDVSAALLDGSLTTDEFARLSRDDGPTPDAVFGTKNGTASGRPATERPFARHAKSGEAVRDEHGGEVTLPSADGLANSGAFLKATARRAGLEVATGSEDRDRLEALYRTPWSGKFGSRYGAGVAGSHAKALLNDSLSGGTHVVPDVFDQDLIVFPLLHGELFPFVDLRPVPMGANVEGATISPPAATWGTAEGTSAPLLDTADLIAEIASSVHTVSIFVEVGRDLLSDSPAAVGAALVEACGMRLSAELDRVVAGGNGTTEPEGILSASGLTSVTTGGDALTIADLESLMFAVGKQYRNAAYRPAFISNDTVYRRTRSIQVDWTDQRRVLGLNHSAYSTLEYPHRIANDAANTTMAFGGLKAYRMFRRAGVSIEWHTEGKELARKNLALLCVRARFAGRVVDPNAFAKFTDGEA